MNQTPDDTAAAIAAGMGEGPPPGRIMPESLVQILQATPDFVAMATADGEMLFLNDGARQMVGLPPSRDGQGFDIPAEARQVGLYRRPDCARRKLLEEGLPTARAEGVWHGQTALYDGNGNEVAVSHTVLAHANADGKVTRFSTIMRDITELVRVKGELHTMAYYSRVTGLPNRQAFHERMADMLEHQAASAGRLGLLVAELERFRDVVQSFGHDTADALLQAFADALRRAVGGGAFIAHVAENAFAVVLPHMAHLETASTTAERIRAELARPLTVGGWQVRRQAYIGIALYPEHGRTSRELLRHAEVARETGKGRGGSAGYWYADPDLSEAVHRRVDLIEGLQQALERGAVAPHYQPLIDPADGGLVGLEALARWHHPKRGWVSPGTFIPLAEETGLIHQLGEAVLSRALADLARWVAQGVAPPRVAVNVSVENLRSPSVVDWILASLDDAGVPAEYLELEVTESQLAQGNTKAIQALSQLRAAGVEVAIDDFGTGYSALAQVGRLPADRLKIDQTFLAGLPDAPDSRTLVDAIARLAEGFGLAVTAEGVETEAQRAYIAQLGIGSCQGFHFAAAEPAEAVVHRLG